MNAKAWIGLGVLTAAVYALAYRFRHELLGNLPPSPGAAAGGFLDAGELADDYGSALDGQGGETPGKATLPSTLAGMFDGIKRDPTKTPQAIARLAADFAKRGFPLAANELQQNAEFRGRVLPGIPYVLQAGDSPQSVAQAFTGDAERWAELVGQPTSKGPLQAKKTGGTQYTAPTWLLSPWWTGERIWLPMSWGAAQRKIITFPKG